MDDAARGHAERIAAERAATVDRIAALTRDLTGIIDATAGANTDDEHDPEGSTIAFERAQVLTLLAAARRQLADLDAALQRLDGGGYGVCAGCGQQIPPARLEARPAATECVACAGRAVR